MNHLGGLFSEAVIDGALRATQRDKRRKKDRLGPVPGRKTWEEKFLVFHEENPKVYSELVRLAREIKGAGVERYGIKALYEVLRYQTLVTSRPGDNPYKLNNNFTAYYARIIEKEEADLSGFFVMRETQT